MFKRLKWERVGVDGSSDIDNEEMETYRAAVPGGWLVTVWADVPTRIAMMSRGNDIPPGHWGGGLTFVPDPEHTWAADIEGSTDPREHRRRNGPARPDGSRR